MTSNNGAWKASGCDLSKDIYFFHRIDSPTVRKNVQTNLGLPNPELLRFMDVAGRGTVELTVNGFIYDPVSLTNGEAIVSDISLEQGENRILYRWTPQPGASTLQMKWRNIHALALRRDCTLTTDGLDLVSVVLFRGHHGEEGNVHRCAQIIANFSTSPIRDQWCSVHGCPSADSESVPICANLRMSSSLS